MNVSLVNEVSLTDAQMQTIFLALDAHAKKVEIAYGLPRTVLALGKKENWQNANFYLTEKQPAGITNGMALAYRVVENGIPTVYASYRKSGKLFGRYAKPFVLKGRTVSPARMGNGYITVLAHELSELIVAPMLDQFSGVDSTGKSWRKEVCDPVLGAYYFANISGQDCVLPDFVLPSFWDTKGVAPFSYLGSKVGPLVWTHPSYAWFRSGISKLLTRVTF